MSGNQNMTAPGPACEPADDSSRPAVLVVDDNQIQRTMCRLILKDAGYRVCCAEDGTQGMELARNVLPDLILLDVAMPVMGGHEMLAMLKEDPRLAHIPVLVVTVESSDSDMLSAYDAGASDYLKKPVNPEELLAKVGLWIRRKRHLEKLEMEIRRLRGQNAFLRSEFARRFDAAGLRAIPAYKPAGTLRGSAAAEDVDPWNEGRFAARRGEHILIVDDEESIVRLQEQILKRFNYSITSSTSSTEALDAFTAQPDKYHLVITDMIMPEKRGDQLAKDLLAIRPDIPIILCTGWSEPAGEASARALGIRFYLRKPVTRLALVRTVRDVLDGTEHNNRISGSLPD